MFWNGQDYCDYCSCPLLDEDRITIKIPTSDRTWKRSYHNRGSGDCADLKIDELKQKFEQKLLTSPEGQTA